MKQAETEVERQIEAAFHHRGHVTVTLDDGSAVEGYLFNRQLGHPKLAEPPYVELFLKGSAERRTVPIARIRGVALTGEDLARPWTPPGPARMDGAAGVGP